MSIAGSAFGAAFKSGMKTTAKNTAITGTMYGAMAYGSSDESVDSAGHYAKFGVAAGIDVGWDIGVTAAATIIGGPIGTALQVGNFAAGMLGYDPATMALNLMDDMDNSIDRLVGRDSPYTQMKGSAQMVQRQMMNLQSTGSNVAEMMHN
jgi:hypothetical protein